MIRKLTLLPICALLTLTASYAANSHSEKLLSALDWDSATQRSEYSKQYEEGNVKLFTVSESPSILLKEFELITTSETQETGIKVGPDNILHVWLHQGDRKVHKEGTNAWLWFRFMNDPHHAFLLKFFEQFSSVKDLVWESVQRHIAQDEKHFHDFSQYLNAPFPRALFDFHRESHWDFHYSQESFSQDAYHASYFKETQEGDANIKLDVDIKNAPENGKLLYNLVICTAPDTLAAGTGCFLSSSKVKDWIKHLNDETKCDTPALQSIWNELVDMIAHL